ncbi:MAG: amidohydrolase [Pelosinus sp.]|nr:amidohydrolase [Pelosinus sp.]
MDKKILELAHKLQAKTVLRRRDFHQYAEAAWTEFRTASIVAETLEKLGYHVAVGEEVIAAAAMMGVPSAAEIKKEAERAIAQGANPKWVQKMQGGKTGIMATYVFGKPGPTVVLRFDMDANDVLEAAEDSHRPYRENFASINKGIMHACGHDGHTAIGLAVAEILSQIKDELKGSVKMIFQPAEEGVRGAKAMAAKGLVDDADYFLGMHLGFKAKKTGQLACNMKGFLATSKYDALFTGMPAHAGAAPETGKNALLAAAAAVLNLQAISRHSEGVSRINVGVMSAGTGRNVIPPNATIKFETRGLTTKINEYMAGEALRVIQGAALMQGVEVSVFEMGGAAACSNSSKLAQMTEKLAKRLKLFGEIMPECDFGASEDCSYFMERVQHQGGEAAYILVGTDLAAGHHDAHFDFDEAALELAVALISAAAADLLAFKN